MSRRLHSSAFLLLALLLASLGFASAAYGHALEPGYLELRQVDEGVYGVVWK